MPNRTKLPSERRTQRVYVPVSESEKDSFDAYAEELGKPTATWLRELAWAALPKSWRRSGKGLVRTQEKER